MIRCLPSLTKLQSLSLASACLAYACSAFGILSDDQSVRNCVMVSRIGNVHSSRRRRRRRRRRIAVAIGICNLCFFFQLQAAGLQLDS